MNQTLLFAIGAVVFAITVCAILLYGYSLFSHSYQDSVADELALRLSAADGDTGDPPPDVAPAPHPLVGTTQ